MCSSNQNCFRYVWINSNKCHPTNVTVTASRITPQGAKPGIPELACLSATHNFCALNSRFSTSRLADKCFPVERSLFAFSSINLNGTHEAPLFSAEPVTTMPPGLGGSGRPIAGAAPGMGAGAAPGGKVVLVVVAAVVVVVVVVLGGKKMLPITVPTPNPIGSPRMPSCFSWRKLPSTFLYWYSASNYDGICFLNNVFFKILGLSFGMPEHGWSTVASRTRTCTFIISSSFFSTEEMVSHADAL